MDDTGKTNEPPKLIQEKVKNTSQKPLPPLGADDDDDEDEDGDVATPKRDRYGNDDEPL